MSSSDTPSTYWAREPILASRDIDDVVVALHPTGTMHGHITKALVTGAATPILPPSVGIELDPATGAPSLNVLRTNTSPAAATDDFTLRGILPGKYFLRANHGWIIKSIAWNGRDYRDTPFDGAAAADFDNVEVVVTNDGAALSGAVRDDRGLPLRDASVFLFPADARGWTDYGLWPPRVRSMVVPASGQFSFSGLPAGDYFVAAIPKLSAPVESPDAPFFESVSRRASAISLTWGQRATVNLVVTGEGP
jgi:hypothetical protein